MKDVSLNYSTFSESDKDNAYENISPLLEKNMLQLAADFYLNVIHMVQKMVGPGCCILAADWNCRMEMAEAVFVDTTLHFTSNSIAIIIVKSNSMNIVMMQAGWCGDSALLGVITGVTPQWASACQPTIVQPSLTPV